MIVKIKNLEADAIIGVYSWEKEADRKLYFNIEVEFDATKAIESDNIEDTIDYDTISKLVIEQTAKTKFDLIEKLADYLIELIMQDTRIQRTRIEIDKPGAVKEADSVSVVEERSR